ncbi:MAG: hypothetical protein ACYCT2_02885 [Thermoplasmataceae archaeon]
MLICLITPSVRVIAGNIPTIGIPYAFIFALGVIVAIAMASITGGNESNISLLTLFANCQKLRKTVVRRQR